MAAFRAAIADGEQFFANTQETRGRPRRRAGDESSSEADDWEEYDQKIELKGRQHGKLLNLTKDHLQYLIKGYKVTYRRKRDFTL